MKDDRLVDIELKITFQEKTVNALNEVVYAQQKEIDQLKTTCKFLMDQVKLLREESSGKEVPIDPPPHY